VLGGTPPVPDPLEELARAVGQRPALRAQPVGTPDIPAALLGLEYVPQAGVNSSFGASRALVEALRRAIGGGGRGSVSVDDFRRAVEQQGLNAGPPYDRLYNPQR
jgi:hypothetical protein